MKTIKKFIDENITDYILDPKAKISKNELWSFLKTIKINLLELEEKTGRDYNKY